MGRKRRRSGGRKGGMMTSMRGGFRSAVKGVTGGAERKPATGARRVLSNLVTAALVIAVAVVVLRRFGVLH